MGRELEFMNMDAAMAKFLWVRLRRKTVPSANATAAETMDSAMKKSGTIHSSLNFSGLRENAYESQYLQSSPRSSVVYARLSRRLVTA